ncbi:lipoate--protein ligase [uncultured Draconibacterium sp.]|uniref:lipoate--protein ligase n=1 Tax=uncultured Draconibacterium sp. TaxID=1573823 RepID=UPI003217DBF7
MICIILENTNPYFCLASEEYLLKNFDDDIFMLWQSEDTVVLGKHQNALAEINYAFVREKNISVARRISGGGTVFHDSGNVNFTFIKNVNSPAEISFKQFTEPVCEALSVLGVEATTSGRNDLLIEGFKVSGNAEHVFKKRVLHHGTLLFNSDLENLGQAIKVVPGKYESKAVQSNRSPVANISSFLKKELSVKNFIEFLIDVQLRKEGNSRYELTENDDKIISQLATEKFETWDWNYGYSPKYSFKNKLEINGKSLDIQLDVKKGHVEECTLSGNFLSENSAKTISAELVGKRHFYEDFSKVLQRNNIVLHETQLLNFF